MAAIFLDQARAAGKHPGNGPPDLGHRAPGKTEAVFFKFFEGCRIKTADVHDVQGKGQRMNFAVPPKQTETWKVRFDDLGAGKACWSHELQQGVPWIHGTEAIRQAGSLSGWAGTDQLFLVR